MIPYFPWAFDKIRFKTIILLFPFYSLHFLLRGGRLPQFKKNIILFFTKECIYLFVATISMPGGWLAPYYNTNQTIKIMPIKKKKIDFSDLDFFWDSLFIKHITPAVLM